MGTIAKLVVQASLNSAKLTKGLKESGVKIRQFAENVKKRMASMGKKIAAGMAIALTAVLFLINKTRESIDELAKTADKLSLPIEELQKLRLAAELTGVSSEKLNTSLEKMVKSVSEAAEGTGLAVKALKSLGLNAREMNRLKPHEQFLKISEAMKQVELSGDKVRFAMEIFGRSGAGLVNTLAADLKGLGKEFDDLGISVTRSQAAAVESMNDAGTKLNAVWEGFKQQVTIAVAPSFQLIIDSIIDVIKNMGGIKEVAIEVAIVVVTTVRTMVEAFEGLSDTLKGLRSLWAATKSGAAEFNPFLSKGIKKDLKDDFFQSAEGIGNRNSSKALNATIIDLKNQQKIMFETRKDIQAMTGNAGTTGVQGAPSPSGFGSITSATGRTLSATNAGIVSNNSPAQTMQAGGFGSISSASRSVTFNNEGLVSDSRDKQQQVNVNIIADKEGIVRAVVDNETFTDRMVQLVETATKEAARATRR